MEITNTNTDIEIDAEFLRARAANLEAQADRQREFSGGYYERDMRRDAAVYRLALSALTRQSEDDGAVVVEGYVDPNIFLRPFSVSGALIVHDSRADSEVHVECRIRRRAEQEKG